jgi:rubredoxin
MLDDAQEDVLSEGDYVGFVAAGARARGEFQCSGCGYGVTVYATLPQCPMCTGSSWEQVAWSPFARARRHELRSVAGD